MTRTGDGPAVLETFWAVLTVDAESGKECILTHTIPAPFGLGGVAHLLMVTTDERQLDALWQRALEITSCATTPMRLVRYSSRDVLRVVRT
jgi:hypothetical protein